MVSPGSVGGDSAYVDASAIIKLVVEEAESDALRRWLVRRRVITGRIAIVEVGRAASRLGRLAASAAEQVLQAFEIVELDAGLAADAARIGPAALRSLDAIHLATALSVRSAAPVFVAYDQRLARAAEAAGFEVVHPGLGPTTPKAS